jgi:hypothetical protein
MTKSNLFPVSLASLVLSLAAWYPASAWQIEGHRMVTLPAVEVLPQRVPSFFRQGGDKVAHGVVDPDLFKLRDTPQLRDQESPEHYLDWEYLEGASLPQTRYEFLRLLADRRLDGSRVGLLPYALVESVQRLAVVFAEHRRWPENRTIQAKALYLAGRLAHLAGDSCQPLHTTIHHDGRADESGRSPRSGIHRAVDSLFERVPFDRQAALADVGDQGLLDDVDSFDGVFARVRYELAASHDLVERVYDLEPKLNWPEDGSPDPALVGFAANRYSKSVWWIASLMLAAWDLSETLAIPDWLDRSPGMRAGTGTSGLR